MTVKTYSYCMRCNSINKIAIDKIKEKQPFCGTCGAMIEMHSLVSEVDLNGLIKMIRKTDLPLVIDFWAPWCGPCKSFGPTFEKASNLFGGKIIFLKINTQEYPNASSQFNIRGIPTLLVYKDGKEIARESGAFPLEYFKSWLGQFGPASMEHYE